MEVVFCDDFIPFDRRGLLDVKERFAISLAHVLIDFYWDRFF